MSLIKSGKKDNSRKSGAAAAHKDQLRKEAQARQAEADKRTPQQQLARLDSQGFRAEKERMKLGKKIMKGKK